MPPSSTRPSALSPLWSIALVAALGGGTGCAGDAGDQPPTCPPEDPECKTDCIGDDCESESCIDRLQAREDAGELTFKRIGGIQGIEDPIYIQAGPGSNHIVVNGVRFAYTEEIRKPDAFVRLSMTSDCRLAHAMADMSLVLADMGVDLVVDVGTYRYRCKDQHKSPPNCGDLGLSQHAQGLALDIAAIRQNDELHTVLTDWTADTEDTPACDPVRENDADPLHELICAVHEAQIWNRILTPNHDIDHANHFHIELTDAASYSVDDFGIDD